MSKLFAGLTAVAALAVMLALPSQARAQEPYPWCAEYGGPDGGGSTCEVVSRAQCKSTVSVIGGYCYENPAYGPARRPSKKSVKPRY